MVCEGMSRGCFSRVIINIRVQTDPDDVHERSRDIGCLFKSCNEIYFLFRFVYFSNRGGGGEDEKQLKVGEIHLSVNYKLRHWCV